MKNTDDLDINIQHQRPIKPRKLNIKHLFNIDDQNKSFRKQAKKSSSRSRSMKSFKQNINNNNFKVSQIKYLKTYQNLDSNRNSSISEKSNQKSSTKIRTNRKINFQDDLQTQNSYRLKKCLNKSKRNTKKMITFLQNVKVKSIKSTVQDKNQNTLRQSTIQIPKYKQKTNLSVIVKQGNKIHTCIMGQTQTLNGYTQIEYNDGGKFIGQFINGQIDKGQMKFPNGYQYIGQFQQSKFHGKGKLIFPSGQIFSGNWKFGNIDGKVKITYPKGQLYYGQVQNFKRNGNGYLYFQNGNKYVGQFKDGQIFGFGQFYEQNQLTKKGFWVYGTYIGTDQNVFKSQNQKIKRKNKLKTQNIIQSIILKSKILE